MSYHIAFNFEDGVTRVIECSANDSIVDAAYRQGINIPMDCREGACSTCKCRVESGDYSLGDYIEDALSQSEADEGFALACQMKPQSDCVIMIPSSSAACNTKQEVYETTITDVRRLSDSTFAVDLQASALAKMGFLPGQYANLTVPGESGSTRSYSFSNAAGSDKVSFLIRNVPGGLMSGYLRERAKAGETISLTGPFGSFYLRPVVRPLLMLAGGTGLAPFLAMLEQLAKAGGNTQPIHLIYGVNTDLDIVEREKIEALAARIPGFSYDVCVVDANSEQPKKGYVTHHIQPAHLNGGEVDIYLCGPPPMVEAVTQYLKEVNVQSRSFHFEKFNASIA